MIEQLTALGMQYAGKFLESVWTQFDVTYVLLVLGGGVVMFDHPGLLRFLHLRKRGKFLSFLLFATAIGVAMILIRGKPVEYVAINYFACLIVHHIGLKQIVAWMLARIGVGQK